MFTFFSLRHPEKENKMHAKIRRHPDRFPSDLKEADNKKTGILFTVISLIYSKQKPVIKEKLL